MRCHRRGSKLILSDVRWRRRERRHGDTEFRFLADDVFVISPRARASRESENRPPKKKKSEGERERASKQEKRRDSYDLIIFFTLSKGGSRDGGTTAREKKRREPFSRVDDSSLPSFVSTSLSDILLSSPFIHSVVFTRSDKIWKERGDVRCRGGASLHSWPGEVT